MDESGQLHARSRLHQDIRPRTLAIWGLILGLLGILVAWVFRGSFAGPIGFVFTSCIITVGLYVLCICMIQKRRARKYLEMGDDMYSPDHEVIEVGEKELDGRDRKFFQPVELFLIGQRFRRIAYTHYRTIEKYGLHRKAIYSNLLDDAGTIHACIVYLKPFGWARVWLFLSNRINQTKVYLFLTRFSDGSLIETTNAGRPIDIEGLVNIDVPAVTSLDKLLAAHSQTVTDRLERNDAVKVIPSKNLDDILAVQSQLIGILGSNRSKLYLGDYQKLCKLAGRSELCEGE